MIISRKRGYVFVHIPKTGGSSLSLALEERAAADDLLIGDTPKALARRRRLDGLTPKGRLWKHATLADIDGVLSCEDISGMFTFTLVRNPWERLLSYYHWVREQTFEHPAVGLARSEDFAGFLTHPQTQISLRANPSTSYMRRADGMEDCDVYIRLEHFAQDAQPLWDHLGFELSLPHVNRSTRPSDYREAYTDRTQAIVADICTEDIARFGYRFE